MCAKLKPGDGRLTRRGSRRRAISIHRRWFAIPAPPDALSRGMRAPGTGERRGVGRAFAWYAQDAYGFA